MDVDRVRDMRENGMDVEPPWISPLRMREREKNPYVNYNIQK